MNFPTKYTEARLIMRPALSSGWLLTVGGINYDDRLHLTLRVL